MREKVIGEPDGELAVVGELLDNRVVVRIVLEAAAGVDRASHAQAVQFPHEMARGIELVLEWQLRAFGKRCVQNGGVGFGEQQACRIASPVAHNFASRWLGCVLRVAHHAQRRSIEDRAIIQMQDEHWRVRCNSVDLVDRGKALFVELMLREAAHHAHPLRRRGDRHLVLEHRHGRGERAHAVPA